MHLFRRSNSVALTLAVLSLYPHSLLSFIVTVPLFSKVLSSLPSALYVTSTTTITHAEDNDQQINDVTPSRRAFLNGATRSALLAGAAVLSSPSHSVAAATAVPNNSNRVLVLGGTGFVGSRVVASLKSLDGVEVVSTSRDGRDGTVNLDFSKLEAAEVSKKVQQLCSKEKCTAVISCVGAIGTADDKLVNAGTGLAAIGAKAAGVTRFVYVSVAPEVRGAAKGLSFLDDYMTGKASSEDAIRENFGNDSSASGISGYTLLEPTFIYGGDIFQVNPPRVAAGYGKLVEGLLSSGPFRAAASISPGIIGVALEPPVRVEAVADAAVAGALGITISSETVLDTYDKIVDASKLLKCKDILLLINSNEDKTSNYIIR